MPLVQALSSMLILSSISSGSAADSLNLVVHKGENFSFDCSEDPDRVIKTFIIHPPNEDKIYSAFDDQPFINKKVTAIMSETCEVNIKEAGLEDNGLWKCDVFIHDENSKSTSISHRYINVTMSEPQEQESHRTLVIVLSIFGVGIFIVAVACYVCIPCHSQNNNGSHNNSHEDTTPALVEEEKDQDDNVAGPVCEFHKMSAPIGRIAYTAFVGGFAGAAGGAAWKKVTEINQRFEENKKPKETGTSVTQVGSLMKNDIMGNPISNKPEGGNEPKSIQ